MPIQPIWNQFSRIKFLQLLHLVPQKAKVQQLRNMQTFFVLQFLCVQFHDARGVHSIINRTSTIGSMCVAVWLAPQHTLSFKEKESNHQIKPKKTTSKPSLQNILKNMKKQKSGYTPKYWSSQNSFGHLGFPIGLSVFYSLSTNRM